MKKTLLLSLLALLLLALIAFPAFAAQKTEPPAYFDESGNAVIVRGLYYNAQGIPCYTADCYYTDGEGNPVYLGGCRAYYRDADGNLLPCAYCYDADGAAISPPSAYRGGCGYGTWRCGAEGTIEKGSFYYDDFGNPVDPPARGETPREAPAGRGEGYAHGRHCCRRAI